MTGFDHYAEARELASLLRKENLDDFATSLIRAMEEGATGTEIFMALRWNIEQLLRANKCSDLTAAKARRLFDELDKALQ